MYSVPKSMLQQNKSFYITADGTWLREQINEASLCVWKTQANWCLLLWKVILTSLFVIQVIEVLLATHNSLRLLRAFSLCLSRNCKIKKKPH